ncbi:MAG: SAM-dependent chlorinase/fluorinase [Ignavibacteriales bacterium]|nr:SAM-dependent chlorinase/fluorinase [Ignavibacteriales bacterium]
MTSSTKRAARSYHPTGKVSAPIIALLTDFGQQDQYVASMKAVMLSINATMNIIDITHEIQPYRIHQAAYMLWSVYNYFPKNTIFVNVVDPGVGSGRRIIVMNTKKYTFIAPDNGLLDFVLYQEKSVSAVEVTPSSLKKYAIGDISSTFHGRDLIAPLAAYISDNVPIKQFGIPYSLPVILSPFVSSRRDVVPMCILHIDSYGNIITNLRSFELEKSMKEIQTVSIGSNMVSKWIRFYDEAPENTPCLIVGSNGLVEISAKKNSAAHLLHATLDSKLKVYWR